MRESESALTSNLFESQEEDEEGPLSQTCSRQENEHIFHSQASSHHDGPSHKQEPICCILNLSVDYVMSEPTPLESDEFQWKLSRYKHLLPLNKEEDMMESQEDLYEERIQVPILRIFGPIIRSPGMDSVLQSQVSNLTQEQQELMTPPTKSTKTNDAKERTKDEKKKKPIEIHQSACLHIHGAYPYMLARPIQAGPDASSAFFKAYRKSRQASQTKEEDDDDDDDSLFSDSSHQKIDWDDVDSVQSIVDDLHYKLEQALRNHLSEQSSNDVKEVPLRFIRQITVVTGRGFYTYCNGGIAPFLRIEYYNPSHRWRVKIMLERGLDVPMEYIPYDYDDTGLASRNSTREDGIQRVDPSEDVGVLQFRCYEAHIPYTMQFFKDRNLAGMSWIKIGDVRFRTPIPMNVKDRIGKSYKGDSVQSPQYILTKNHIPQELRWIRRDFNDLELSEEDLEAWKRHLELMGNEFWTKKETSCDLELDTNVWNILNVQDVIKEAPNDPEVHWRAVPSLREIWMEERLRMSELVPTQDNFLSNESPTRKGAPSFTLSVKKNADTPGARLALTGSKRLMVSTPGLYEDYRRALRDIVERHYPSLQHIDKYLQIELNQKMKEKSERKRAKDLEISKGLDLLLGEFSQNQSQSQNASGLNMLLQHFSQKVLPESDNLKMSQMTKATRGSRPALKSHQQLCSQISQTFLTQNISEAPTFTQADMQEMQAELQHCDTIDRPCDDEDPQDINPETLTPYEEGKDDFFDDEEDMEEEEFERCLTMLATQELNSKKRANRDDTKKKQVVEDDEESHRLQSLSESQSSHKFEDIYYETFRDEFKEPEIGLQLSSSSADNSERSNGQFQYNPLGQDSQGSHSFAGSVNSSQDEEKKKVAFGIPNESSQESCATKVVSWKDCKYLALRIVPPQRQQCDPNTTAAPKTNKLWYPLLNVVDNSDNSLPWLKFSLPENHRNKFKYQLERGGGYLEPVTKPPSTKKIRRWLSRKRKSEILEDQKRKKRKESTSKVKDIKNELEYDDNTRKLVSRIDNPRKKRVAFAETVQITTCTMLDVEEVTWKNMSQDENLNTSQDSFNSTEIMIKPGIEESDSRKNQNMESIETKLSIQSPKTQSPSKSQSPLKFTALSNISETQQSKDSNESDALLGIGQVGGRIFVEGGGGLKTATSRNLSSFPSTKLTIMSIEVHVQCRKGKAGVNDSREIAMKADPSRDAVGAVCYSYGLDPGGGENMVILERGAIYVPNEGEISSHRNRNVEAASSSELISLIGKTMGCASSLKIEVAGDERKLLLRLASIVRYKDPDTLISWDTQSGGLGYLIDRGLALGGKEAHENNVPIIDMVRLLGRTPMFDKTKSEKLENKGLFDNLEQNEAEGTNDSNNKFKGSGLGGEWDDRVGAGAGPSSIIGRLIFCCRKIIAEEVKHPNNSYQPAMLWTVMRKRIPNHDDLILTRWYGENKGIQRWRVLKHRIAQAHANLLLFDALDIIGRAGEAARLSGVEFSQSFPGIRGSQYKVEGVLLRALQSLQSDERGEKKGSKKSASLSVSSEEQDSQTQSPWKVRRNLIQSNPDQLDSGCNQRGYFFFSPSKSDCKRQEALECQAMTLEPQSGFHFDPVVVCDFTALYPSLVIAYNLCYSTSAGKLEYHSTRKEMRQKGKTTEKLGPFHYDETQSGYVLRQHMKSLLDSKLPEKTDRAYTTPTGSIYVSEGVLKGVLPSVLDEILSTRAMIKKAAKQYKKSMKKPPPAVLRQLEARQLALKYVANVTYGYTSATFSGRSAMPLLADSIVECGRKTLTNAILLANEWGKDENGRWKGAHVVYGDTDSIFIKLPGRTVKEAFVFGNAFCDAVTAANPPPVQLKLEKVYKGCLLQTKKKYCGMKFESPDQKSPSFEAKGIETIRKDQCDLTQKILRNSLINVFQNKGVNKLQYYLNRQWALIHSGRLPVSNFILTGRVRSSYRGKTGPVQAALAKRLAEADPGRVMHHKERLPYVIVASPGRSFKLRDCVLTPNELLAQWDSYTIHSQYYTTKHVNAALNRCFSLAPFRIDINTWYEAAPKPQKRLHHWPVTRTGNSAMISVYFGSDTCSICGKKAKSDGNSKSVICAQCKVDQDAATFLALQTLHDIQQKANAYAKICQSCNGCMESSGTYAPEKAVEKKKNRFLQNSSASEGFVSGGVVSPISICTCIDCPVTYKRHELRESEIEAIGLCKALNCLN